MFRNKVLSKCICLILISLYGVVAIYYGSGGPSTGKPVNFSIEFGSNVSGEDRLVTSVVGINNSYPVVTKTFLHINICAVCPSKKDIQDEINFITYLGVYAVKVRDMISDISFFSVMLTCYFGNFSFDCIIEYSTNKGKLLSSPYSYGTTASGDYISIKNVIPPLDKAQIIDIYDDLLKRWWPVLQKIRHLGEPGNTIAEFWFNSNRSATNTFCIITSPSTIRMRSLVFGGVSEPVSGIESVTVDSVVLTAISMGNGRICSVESDLGWSVNVTPPYKVRLQRRLNETTWIEPTYSSHTESTDIVSNINPHEYRSRSVSVPVIIFSVIATLLALGVAGIFIWMRYKKYGCTQDMFIFTSLTCRDLDTAY